MREKIKDISSSAWIISLIMLYPEIIVSAFPSFAAHLHDEYLIAIFFIGFFGAIGFIVSTLLILICHAWPYPEEK